MSERLKLSERMRVAIAVSPEVTLDREMAILAMRAFEVMERAPSYSEIMANLEAIDRKRDQIMFSTLWNVTIVCTCLALVGIWL